MAIQLQKIQLNYATYSTSGGVSGYVKEFSLSEVAEALGAKVDAETEILYFGDDPTTGFKIADGSSGYTVIEFYLKGELAITSESTRHTESLVFLYYAKSENGCIFGISRQGYTPYLCCICSKGTNVIDGTETLGYVIYTYKNGEKLYLFTENGDALDINFDVTNAMASDTITTLVPIADTIGNIVFEHMFFRIAGKSQSNAYGFEMNGKTYYALKSYGSSGNDTKAVLEL